MGRKGAIPTLSSVSAQTSGRGLFFATLLNAAPTLVPSLSRIRRGFAILARDGNHVCVETNVFQGVIRMSGGFEDRKKGFENKWAHDEELRFKVFARRNKLLGLWAAEKAGISGADAETYAREVVKADFAKPGDGDVFDKIKADFAAKSLDITEHTIRRTMEELLETAKEQVSREA